MTTYTDEQLLSFDGIAERTDSFRFELLDTSLNHIGDLHPQGDQPPSVSNDVTRTVMRTLNNFTLPVDEVGDVNALSDRVRAWMTLENGSEYSLGIFMFTDFPRKRRSFGVYATAASLGDLWTQVNQEMAAGSSFAPGATLTAVLTSLVTGANVRNYDIETTYSYLKDPLSFEIGHNRAEAITSTAKQAGMVTYFDRDGTFIARTLPSLLSESIPDFVYAEGGVIKDDTIEEGDVPLDAPNLYTVISTNSMNVPVVGTYRVPASAPHSYENRGFWWPKTINMQGLNTQAEANTAARAAAQADEAGFEWANFTTAADPRHDTYDVVQYRGVNFREIAWDLTLSAGGDMRHSLRKVYT